MKAVKEVFNWLATISLAVLAALLINVFIFQPHQVLGSSMQPSLENGDIGIMSKVSHTFNTVPDYNDIVIIDSRVGRRHTIKDDIVDSFTSNVIANRLFSYTNHTYWIKRVVGKPGDKIEFKAGQLYRNGKLLNEEYINEPASYGSDRVIDIPEKHIFVMGDNRNHSTDSRDIGCVPLGNVMGKLIIKF